MRTRMTAVSVIACVLLLATGCGGGDDDGASASASSTTAAERAGGESTSSGGDGASSDTTDAGEGDSSGTSTTAAAKSGGGPVTEAVGVKPGRYVYVVSGTASGGTPPTTQRHEERSTMIVDPATGRDQRTDQSDPSGQGTEIVARYENGAVYLVSMVLRGQLPKEFRPAKPVLAMKANPASGDTWTWDMRSTDGTTTMHDEATVQGREQVRIGGRSIDAHKVRHKITLTTSFNGAPITINIDRTGWEALDLRLTVKTFTVTDVPGFVHDESTATLESVEPS
jgi:hypothetical protein